MHAKTWYPRKSDNPPPEDTPAQSPDRPQCNKGGRKKGGCSDSRAGAGAVPTVNLEPQPEKVASAIMATKGRLQELVREFLAEVPSIKQPRYHEFNIREIYPAHDTDDWRIKPGVYYFSSGVEVQYVGSGVSRYGMGYRIYERLKKIGLDVPARATRDDRWSAVLDRPDSIVGIFEFDPDEVHETPQGLVCNRVDWYGPLVLEALLIASLKPQLNDKGKDWGDPIRLIGPGKSPG